MGVDGVGGFGVGRRLRSGEFGLGGWGSRWGGEFLWVVSLGEGLVHGLSEERLKKGPGRSI